MVTASPSAQAIVVNPLRAALRALLRAGVLVAAGAAGAAPAIHRTGLQSAVQFTTENPALQRLWDRGMAQLAGNLKEFAPGLTILVEGGGYGNAWIETQPMGGEMFARQNVQVALNNQMLFMLTQRADGRLPGMVLPGSAVRKHGWDAKGFPPGHQWFREADLVADYEMFQGYCFPEPAWRMYFLAGLDQAYLKDLYAALKGHDDYLWRTRDSNGDGLLETWCIWDTGEDGSTRLHQRGARENWPFEQAPGSGSPGLPALAEDARVPFQSMDIMAYSYSGRAVLAKVSEKLGNGEAGAWRRAAAEVRRRVVNKLWDPSRHACFDRDRHGRVLPELIHNNLRCMWHGLFTQEMADAFIRHHLLNPDEFWTPVPLVSIAANDPLFLSRPRNNWSGQPQGLTFQRAIGALENYGHIAEVTLLGRVLLPVLVRNGGAFSQQLDPITGTPSLSNSDGYGPMILAMQGYVARMHGVHLDVEHERVWWSGLNDGGEGFRFHQRWGGRDFLLVADKGGFTGAVGGDTVFHCTGGVRVVTDLAGGLRELAGIAPEPVEFHLRQGGREWRGTVRPNQVLGLDDGRIQERGRVAFDYPHPRTRRDPQER